MLEEVKFQAAARGRTLFTNQNADPVLETEALCFQVTLRSTTDVYNSETA
jgi:hypothetical protein